MAVRVRLQHQLFNNVASARGVVPMWYPESASGGFVIPLVSHMEIEVEKCRGLDECDNLGVGYRLLNSDIGFRTAKLLQPPCNSRRA